MTFRREMRSEISTKKGFTLIEMLVTLTILSVLAAAAIPLAKVSIKREKEIQLKRNLRLIREAIDEYKRLADENKFQVEEDSEGYPPDLETLIKGVEVEEVIQGKKVKRVIKFLRKIPQDPMTNSVDWGLRSYQDDPDSTIWGGENVYDVFTKSPGTALDGTKYRDW